MDEPSTPAEAPPFCILVMAASRGGLDVLSRILRDLPPGLMAAIFIVMHIGDHPSNLPAILNRVSALPVRHAHDGMPLQPGTVTVAPPDHHMELAADRVRLHRGPKEHHTRPAADPLFRSAAEVFGRRVIGVVLTGGDSDGAHGLQAITRHGGQGVVEDPARAEAPEMPERALKLDTPHFFASRDQLGRLLAWLVEHQHHQLGLIQPPPRTSSPS